MLGRYLGGIAVALLLALFAALPTAALAAEEEQEGANTFFSLKASHGYRMYVFGSAEFDDGRGEVAVYLLKGRTTAAYYGTEGTVTDTSLEADFGKLGQIDLELHLSGKEGRVRSRPPCGEGSEEYEKATYRGTLEFSGEEGFSEVSVSRVRVSPKAWVDLLCANHFRVETDEHDLEPGAAGASLHATLRPRNRGGVELELTKSRPDGRTLVTASVAETRHGISIQRGVQFLAGGKAFRYDRALSSASVRLPGPFSGSAVYRRDAKPANRWLGNLSVDLPGRADVPLVRPALRLALVPATWSVEPPEFR